MIISGDVTYHTLPIGVAHAIYLEARERPLFRPLYNLSVKELVALREYLD
jgi:hypothetical protein